MYETGWAPYSPMNGEKFVFFCIESRLLKVSWQIFAGYPRSADHDGDVDRSRLAKQLPVTTLEVAVEAHLHVVYITYIYTYIHIHIYIYI